MAAKPFRTKDLEEDEWYDMTGRNSILFYEPCSGENGGDNRDINTESCFKIDNSVSAADFWYPEGCLDNGTCTAGIYTTKTKMNANNPFLLTDTITDDDLGGMQYIYAENYNYNYNFNSTIMTPNGGSSTRKYYWIVLPDMAYSNGLGDMYVATFENLSEPIYLITYDVHACEHQSPVNYCAEAKADPDGVALGINSLGAFTRDGGNYAGFVSMAGKITSLCRIDGTGEVLASQDRSYMPDASTEETTEETTDESTEETDESTEETTDETTDESTEGDSETDETPKPSTKPSTSSRGGRCSKNGSSEEVEVDCDSDGLTEDQAWTIAHYYNLSGEYTPVGCCGLMNCVEFSNFFLSQLTTFGRSTGGNGGQIVSGLSWSNKGSTPSVWAVFSKLPAGKDRYGHTGVVVGQNPDGTYITVEAAYGEDANGNQISGWWDRWSEGSGNARVFSNASFMDGTYEFAYFCDSINTDRLEEILNSGY